MTKRNPVRGQALVEYILLISVLMLGLVSTWAGLKKALFDYYVFLTKLVCLPIP